jgi:flagellar biosynthesis protein FliO
MSVREVRLRRSGRRPRSRFQAPRLAVIDSAPIDRRRTLVLIRRDKVEQLVMIGGPNDVVIEQNVRRAIDAPERAQRVAPRLAVRDVEFSPKLMRADVPPRPRSMQSRIPITRKPAPPLEPHPSPQGLHDVGDLRDTLKALLDEQGLGSKHKPMSNKAAAKSEAEIEAELIEPKSVEESWTKPN